MNLLVINGSPRKLGRTTKLTKWMSQNYQTNLLDLSELTLPIFNGEEETRNHTDVQKALDAIKSADAIILATPEYHGSMSGALKNALDFIDNSYFIHKPVALLAVCGGGKGGINALNSVRTVARALYANVLSKQLALDPGNMTEQGELLEPAKTNMDLLINELKFYTSISKQLMPERSL
ncbi:NADPH-dependent FMN reductase [Bacillus massilinigeriensis]|uniref:NADPH-dependent FMN reductase n=1 Tax=Bacillus mediterraneensis TaxID=1805474 RepID=UPI0008F96F20|nr:NAD(P)H-dependent oxidoreductase [Bacillus mediterraneensis]